MARIARITAPGVLHHVISRFVDREWFFASDTERARYLDLLGNALAKSDWRCLAYCLMSNHIHLAMVAGKLELETWARKVNPPFARWLNAQRGRLGPVFADRPAAYAVPREREAEVIAYVHNNPVRAKVVASARGSSWSSHRAYTGLGPCPPWLHVSEGLARLGCTADPARFDRLVRGLANASLELPDLDHVRAAVRRFGSYEVGTPVLSIPAEIPVVCRRFVRRPTTATALLEAAATAAGVPMLATTRRYARGTVAMVKRVVIHAAVNLGISMSDAAAVLNVSRQRASTVAQSTLSASERAMMDMVVELLSLGAPQSCQS